MKPPPPPLEYQEEAILSDVLEIAGLWHFHIPNEVGPRIGRLKKIGFLPGAVDHFIGSRVPGRTDIRGVFVEMKRKKGGRPSGAQWRFAANAEEHGYFVIFASGADDAIRQLLELGYDLRL